MSLESRFWSKVAKSEGCWVWLGTPDSKGYGRIRFGGAGSKIARAHRVSWQINRGPIPQGLVIDHLCGVRLCVNPDHLEPVTQKENLRRAPSSLPSKMARKTACVNGHEYVEGSFRIESGARRCLICKRKRESLAYYNRKG